MGLLDALFPASDGGGLLDFLKNNASAAVANYPGGLPSDQAQYGNTAGNPAPAPAPAPAMPSAATAMGAPMQAAPQNAPAPAPAPAPQMASPIAPPAPSLGNNLMAAYETMHNKGGLVGSIMAGITGQRMDPQGQALQRQAKIQNLTARALVAKGVDPATAQAAVLNPDLLKTIFAQKFGPNNYKVVQTGQDVMGGKQFGVLNPSATSPGAAITPIKGAAGGSAAAGGPSVGDMSKTGAAYLATVPATYRSTMQGMIDGTIQPPSSFALTKPYWQAMIAGAKNLDPNFDENTWTARHKMQSDLAASGNSSMGGILSNGKSAFEHLREVAQNFADLGNVSHDFPLGGALAYAENRIGDHYLPSSKTGAKVTKVNTALGHYGQEATKFYAGSGGGAEERMGALLNMDPTKTSGEQQAAFLETEKNLMTDRLRQKEAQIRSVMGDQYLAKHPVFTPQLQATIAKIDASIAKLRGQPATAPTAAPSGAAAAGAIQDGQIIHNPSTGATMIRQNGQWVPFS